MLSLEMVIESLVNYSVIGSFLAILKVLRSIFIVLYIYFGKALLFLGKHIPIIKDFKNPFYRLDIFEHAMIPVQIENGLIRAAIKSYNRAINKMPTRLDNYNNLAACYLFLGEEKLAKHTLSLLIKQKYKDKEKVKAAINELENKTTQVILDIRNYKMDLDKMKAQIRKNEPGIKGLVKKVI